MSISIQLWAIDEDEIERLDQDATYFDETYATDVDGESLWLDKAGIGIVQVLGGFDDDGSPSQLLLGETLSPIESYPAPYLSPPSVRLVADHLAGISDDGFVRLAQGALDEPDVEYHLDHFRRLRAFYVLAAERGRAIVVSPPG